MGGKSLIEQHKAYVVHRNGAKARGIEFKLSFDDWWDIWAPHWGRKKAELLQMCRTRDQGAYELGNVRIDTPEGNARDRSIDTYQPKYRQFEIVLPVGQTLPERVARFEARILRRALKAHHYNQTATAATLGISFRAIRYAIRKYSK